MMSICHVTIFLLAGLFRICHGNVELFCVVSPPVLDSDAPTPVTLTAFISGSIVESTGYSITFSSRDDPRIVTDSHRVTFGKIGTQKGEKGDKGDRPAVTACPGAGGLTGPKGEPGLNGAESPGPPGPPGPLGPTGDQGPAGNPGSGTPTGDGANEQYCMGEVPDCVSIVPTRQCVKGQKGMKGALGPDCTPGRQGEKGEPPKPDYSGPAGPPGDPGSNKGTVGPAGADGADAMPAFDAPQPNCDTPDPNQDLATIIVAYTADMGDAGEPGDPATLGAKGEKGDAGTPGPATGTPGSAGAKGSPGPVGSQGPAGNPGTSVSSDSPGLRIRPRYMGPNPEPQCLSNIQVAAKTLKLRKPDDLYKKDTRFGVFSCDLTTPEYQEHVPVLLNNQQELFPADAKRTHVVSVLESLELCVDDSIPKNCVSQLEWVHNGEKTSQLNKFSGSRCMKINRVTPEHAGVYEAYRRPIGRNAKEHAFFLVIVRECQAGYYNAPSCDLQCTTDCNGRGYCDAASGDCVCAHGFFGNSCENALGEGNVGTDTGTETSCLDLGYGRSCEGIMVCSKKAGCSCASGWKGMNCDEACEDGTYGPDCCFSCTTANSVCNRFTGEACPS